jgi:hypothetical protein
MNLALARRQYTNVKPKLVSVRPLVPIDLEALRQPTAKVKITRIRERHHDVARLAASGLTNREIAYRLGYAETRICTLLQDPSIVELVKTYTAQKNEAWLSHIDQIQEDALRATAIASRMILDELEDHDEAGTRPPLKELVNLSADRMDRFGYGKRQTNVNVNVDFAKRLEAAITRSRKTIEP